MRWHVLAVGKPKLEFARAGIEEYAKRIAPFAPLSIEYLRSSNPARESAVFLERSEKMLRIVLDQRGEMVTSEALAKRVSSWEQRSERDAALLIGGADGHTDQVRQAASWVWSLSALTLQHELALVIALEQIYRAYTIKAGLPYHRE